ncbi:E3 ubiquitin-protein ligase MARCHF11 [Polypterus senegalus]|nr:E3 ubiquitin-protein ligase MARCHF11 [Polypterus senegalus]XP_039610820.1 E3 ubiquitin-protein ligase MARCHF11 [Polypterus senegalus]
MSLETEAGPVYRGTEPEPKGGATAGVQSSSTDRRASDWQVEEQQQHHPGLTRQEELNPGEGHSGCSGEDSVKAVNGEGSYKVQPSHSDCSSENSIPTPSCRICFQGAEQGELLYPCRCDGSVRYTHKQCLLKWISERGSWSCELCCYRYQVKTIKMKRPCQWQPITITLVEKVQIIAVFLGSLFLVASISWLMWSALSPFAVWQRRDVLFQICYGMYGFMDLVCIGLIIHEGAAVFNVFKRWRAVNLHWDVENYDKTADVEENSSNGGSSASKSLWLPLASFRNRGSIHPSHVGSHRYHCGFTLLQLCNRLTNQEDTSEDNSSGVVVMRVTSV